MTHIILAVILSIYPMSANESNSTHSITRHRKDLGMYVMPPIKYRQWNPDHLFIPRYVRIANMEASDDQ